jgi:hypothetical protein
MGREMTRRHTAQSDRQLEAAVPAMIEMLNDPDVVAQLENILHASGRPDRSRADIDDLLAAAEPLADYCRARDFAFARMHGRYLGDWITLAICVRFLVSQGYTAEASKDALRRAYAANPLDFPFDFWPERTERLKPDNPLGLAEGNEAVLNAKRAGERDFMALRAYFKSLKPAVARGRKAGTPKAKGSGRKEVDAGQAKRALGLSRLGRSADEIAEEERLWKDGESRYDEKAVRRVRSRARYLVRAGELAESKQL